MRLFYSVHNPSTAIITCLSANPVFFWVLRVSSAKRFWMFIAKWVQNNYDYQVVILPILSVIVLAYPLFIMLKMHWGFVRRNQTTLESAFEPVFIDPLNYDAFDLGTYHNIRQVGSLASYKLSWACKLFSKNNYLCKFKGTTATLNVVRKRKIGCKYVKTSSLVWAGDLKG